MGHSLNPERSGWFIQSFALISLERRRAVAAADRPTGIAVLLVVMGCTKGFYVNLVYLQNRSL